MHSKKLFVLVVSVLFSAIASFGSVPKDYTFFHNKPDGIAKDFYISRYLDSPKCSKEDAWALLEQISRMTYPLFHAFAAKMEDAGWNKVSQCLKLEITKLLATDDQDCIAIGLSVFEASKLEKKKLKELASKLDGYKEAVALRTLAQDDIFATMLQHGGDAFFEVFNKIGAAYRLEHFNKPIDAKIIENLTQDKRFNDSIKLIITDAKLKNIQKSLLHVSPSTNGTLTHQSLFFLGLNALKFDKLQLAMAFFDASYELAYYRIDKDKTSFWRYLISKDTKYIKQLQESFDINIYTLLAKVEPKNIIIPKAYAKHPNFDEKDPFEWTNFLNEIANKTPQEYEKLAQSYLYKNTIGHYSFLMERARSYKEHYFPVAYAEFLPDTSIEKKALILALARQESRFIPSAISSSYALGTMQFMPFLAKAIAKEQKFVDFELDAMFNPQTAYLFADIHLLYLQKYLHHPLLVAYAYNGGIGFTKRVLRSGLFSKNIYEPYMSIELIAYDESREYGKKVLANYVIYSKILGSEISAQTLIEKLLEIEKNHKF